MKDNFSAQAKDYAKFRPRYPELMFEFIFSLVKNKYCSWDCGTGNGQVAGVLADYFNKVFATDISKKQIDYAVQKQNIKYSIQSAEETNFQTNQFDLVTVAQAIHWFNFDQFYSEVKRTLQPDGILAVIGYGNIQSEKNIQPVIDHLYNIVGDYWDKERNILMTIIKLSLFHSTK